MHSAFWLVYHIQKELSTTLVPEVVCVRHFSPWHLEINSLVPEVAFRRLR